MIWLVGVVVYVFVIINCMFLGVVGVEVVDCF